MKRKNYRYFAYGSNMSQQQLERRVGKVLRAGTASLQDYELQFNCGTDFGSYANIVPKEGSSVSGVIYILSRKQIKILDRFELLYDREVVKINGRDAVAYIAWRTFENFSVLPRLEYLNIILNAYLENKLNKSYRNLKDKVNNYYRNYGNEQQNRRSRYSSPF